MNLKISAVILAGGESRRMGRDKAWLKIEGQFLIARVASTLRKAGIQEIFISGRAGTDYSALNCPVLIDRKPGGGPLGGIERALEASTGSLVLVLAVDLPRMRPAFLRKVIAECDEVTGVVPTLAGKLEPLVAVYPKHCDKIARDCLAKSQRSARRFAAICVRKRAVTLFNVPARDYACFDNWNTPDCLKNRFGQLGFEGRQNPANR